jgi:hypothetical protein
MLITLALLRLMLCGLGLAALMAMFGFDGLASFLGWASVALLPLGLLAFLVGVFMTLFGIRPPWAR